MKNIFLGKKNRFGICSSEKEKRPYYATIIYGFFMDREWFTYADVINSLDPNNKLNLYKISTFKGYGQLKKAFGDVIRALTEKLETETCVEISKYKHSKKFRYVGEEDDPLEDMLNVKHVMNLKSYCKFCRDSAGLLPKEWLEYFFKGYQDLAEIHHLKRKGEQFISVGIDRQQRRIELFPKMYVAIENKSVLQLEYKPFEEPLQLLVFHPHYLKEHNGRWHLFGHAEGKEPEFGYNLALDRIIGDPIEIKDKKFLKAPSHFYEEFFKDIVGVSHVKGAKVEKIILRTHTLYMHNLILTKQIHQSQKEHKPFALYEDGEYGEILLVLEPNKEFMGRVLMMGAGLEVVSPQTLRQDFTDEVNRLLSRYKTV